MKRVDLIRHLETNGCEMLREGGNHSVYVNRAARKTSTVPRHREINQFLARKICRDLEIPIFDAWHADDRGVYVTTSHATLRAVQEQVRAWMPGVTSLADEVLVARKKRLWAAPKAKRHRAK